MSLPFAEALYGQWQADPSAVPEDWARYFASLDPVPARVGPRFKPASLFHGGPGGGGRTDIGLLQDRVDQLIRAFRVRGHMEAHLDPLDMPRRHVAQLDPQSYGLGAHLERRFSTATIAGTQGLTLREILDILRQTYCRSIGVQFMHIDDLSLKRWLTDRMERTRNRLELSREEQIRVLSWLTDAVELEEFIQRKYIGAKSFSLEGAESLIPLMKLAIAEAGTQRLDEVVIGMAHRGRLNVLVNVMGKSARAVFQEFDDPDPHRYLGGGDVKYHLGYSTDITTPSGHPMHLSLCFNPSHLGFVGPVALGRMRAKQDRTGDTERQRGMVLLIHGDAAFAGEGVTQETLNLSQLPGYTVGGTIHVVVNNQIGFTTPTTQARSTPYATSVAKMLQSPIFHVNGEDPEAVCQVVKLAMEFRHTFGRDVVIDLYCYRRRGHNEGDEPAFTQPLMTRAIQARPSVRESYLDRIVRLGALTRDQGDEIVAARRAHLEDELNRARNEVLHPGNDSLRGIWHGYRGGPDIEVPEAVTAVPVERLGQLLEGLAVVPDGFTPHPKIQRLLGLRRAMARGERRLDWAAGEALAFATLATEGARIRLSGQDVERGTFSHRHAVLHDLETGHTHCPLAVLAPDQAAVEITNSPLSEVAVLGFDFGYSLDCPDGLVAWEAQFGDFVNVAQVILDQFVSSTEDKWWRLSGLVLQLPHGFEGMGPEHSSARLERFLQQSAEDCWQVCNLTTPAQIFHVLRRQVVRPWRKPLVLMSPKSLLRHPGATSTLDDLATGGFQRAIGDPDMAPAEARRILLCSGRIYYDLLRRRTDLRRDDVPILRLEQLYPLQTATLEQLFAPYAPDAPVVWVQDEPENMGAWQYLRMRLGDRLLDRHPLSVVARVESASPATGSRASHDLEQEQLLEAAFGGLTPTHITQVS